MKGIDYECSKTRYTNAQHMDFMSGILGWITAEVAATLGLEDLRSAFAEAVERESLCFNPDKGFLETPEVLAADRRRVEVFLFYKNAVLNFADYCPDESLREVAAPPAFLFRSLANAGREEYTGKTATLGYVADQLARPPYAEALERLGLAAASADIASANKAFEAIYMRRAAETRARSVADKTRALRPLTDRAFDALAKAINALYAANELGTGDEERRALLDRLIDGVNAHILQSRMAARKRRKGATDGEGEAGFPDGEG